MVLFAMSVTVTIYVISDTTILGFLCDDYTVGVYSVSVKIYSIVKTVLSSVLVVSIPRLSALLGTNDKKKFIVEFQAPIQQLSEKDMEKLMERVKFQSQAKVLNSMLLKSSELKPIEKITPVEKTECKKENKKEEDKKEIEKENV